MRASKLVAVALLYDNGQYLAAKIRKVIVGEVECQNEVSLTMDDPREVRILRLEVEIDLTSERQATQEVLEAGRRLLDE